MSELTFFIFWIFLLFFFLEFSCFGCVGTKFGTKIFSLFLGLSHPVLAKNNAGMRFFNFFSFIAIFFAIFFPGPCMNRIRDQNFFFSLSRPISSPVLLNKMPERGFLIFWSFLLFLLELSCPGHVWTEFGTKIFFSLSWSPSTRFG